jgi:DNA mismatch endonuclease (patch repair protein)
VAEPPVKSYELRDKCDLINSACCKIPSSNREFWVAKIRRNQERDQQNYNILYENGWHVIVIWECQLTPTKIEHTMREVEVLLEENMLALYKKRTSLPYSFDEEPVLPMAAEDGRN